MPPPAQYITPESPRPRLSIRQPADATIRTIRCLPHGHRGATHLRRIIMLVHTLIITGLLLTAFTTVPLTAQ